jgi:hypothetical protein
METRDIMVGETGITDINGNSEIREKGITIHLANK